MAAGKGVRMLPLTENTPKPLLTIKDKVILDWTISQLPGKIDQIIMVIGYRGEQVREHVKKYHSEKNVIFVEENEAKGTGYAVKVCQPYVKGKFLVLNGDDLYDKKGLEKLIAEEGYAFLVRDVRNDLGYPEKFKRMTPICVSDDGFYKDHDKPENCVVMNTGAYFIDDNYFNFELVTIANGEYGLPHTLFANSKQFPLKAVYADFWVPIGFPEDIKYAEQFI